MPHSHFTHPRFVAFRELLGYVALAPGAYLAPYKHQALVNAPELVRRIVRAFLPTLYLEADLDPATLRGLLRRDHFCVQGTTYAPVPGLRARERGTFVIDLRRPEQELWDSFDHSLRKQLGKDEVRDLRVEPIRTEKEVRAYYALLCAFRAGEGFRTPNTEVALLQWRALHAEGVYEVFTVRDGSGALLAGMGLIVNADTGACIEVAAVREKSSAPVMDVLRWGIIRWAKERGLRSYDLAGVDPHAAPGTKDEGIYRYKRKWGGAFAVVYHYETYCAGNRWYYPLMLRLLQWTGFARS